MTILYLIFLTLGVIYVIKDIIRLSLSFKRHGWWIKDINSIKEDINKRG